MTYCKECQGIVKFEYCNNPVCARAYARGFCGKQCQKNWDQERNFEIERTEKQAHG